MLPRSHHLPHCDFNDLIWTIWEPLDTECDPKHASDATSSTCCFKSEEHAPHAPGHITVDCSQSLQFRNQGKNLGDEKCSLEHVVGGMPVKARGSKTAT